jgi:hypothetical protein
VLFIYSAKACLRGKTRLASSSGLRGHKRTYLTILESADHALFKMVRYVLLRPLRPELDAKTKTCLPAKTRFCHLDEQAKSISFRAGSEKTLLRGVYFRRITKFNFCREASPAQSIPEDVEDLRSQVDFLNSVIVDMQRKNDELKAKLDLLEAAGLLDTVDIADLVMLNGIDTNRVAPRLFCDICDEFDLHDTEDCPTQAMPDQDQIDESSHTQIGGQRGQIREYCTNCEMFGHSVDKCDENETF